MIKILNIDQIQALDRYTIANEPISSIDLMERACLRFVTWFVRKFQPSERVTVFAGTGNNGGDALGIARLLVERKFDVDVLVVRGGEGSPDFKTNYERLSSLKIIHEIKSTTAIPDFNTDVIIDGLFGSGLTRPVEGLYADVIRALNKAQSVRVAIDIPSGLMADKPSPGEIFRADFTITFQLPKLSFLLSASAPFVGDWHVVDIGLSGDFISGQESRYRLLEAGDVRQLLKSRLRFDHKGTFGKALLVCGGYGKMGAAVLSARAAVRSGLGLLTVHIPGCGYEILQTAIPEAMVSVDDDNECFSSGISELAGYVGIGIGPGIGTRTETAAAFGRLMQDYSRSMVIDADGINILASGGELVHLIPAKSILTPHPGELKRLIGGWKDDFDRLDKSLNFAAKTNTYLLVKGAFTSIATPEGHLYFNPTGNPGMATGGSGDVLTGILTSLLAQGYTSQEAAILGTYVHGLAGDFAAERQGQIALIPSDIIRSLPRAFRVLATE